MGQFSNVFPPEDLVKLDAESRQKLREAITKVMHSDPDVRKLIREKNKLIREKTWKEYEQLLGKGSK